MFGGAEGGYLPRPLSNGGWFTSAVKRSLVQTITPHDLRHTCASLAVSAGANDWVVSRMLGHRDPSMTLQIYAYLFDIDLDAVAERLNSGWQGARRERIT
jgi:integrase